ncbi:MAG TPA: hypothetical protein VG184_08040 [Acidimicrobiales bacterium]|nr:hypothetical protein [Acidimicrobiales bacterium]
MAIHLIATAAGPRHAAFVALVSLHVIAAVVGFGGVALSGAYGALARDRERVGMADDARRWFASPNRAALAVLAVPVFAAAALVTGGRTADLGQLWVTAALAVWLVAAAAVTMVVRPAEAVLRAALTTGENRADGTGGPSGVGSGAVVASSAPGAVAGAARRLSRAAAVCDVAFTVALALMIWQPSW